MTIQKRNKRKDNCVISRLIKEGSYDLLLDEIFTLLDFQSLISCGKVCTLWRGVIINVIRR